MTLEYWVMARVCKVLNGNVPRHYIGSINADALVLVGDCILEPVESFGVEDDAHAKAADCYARTGVVHHVVLNVDC